MAVKYAIIIHGWSGSPEEKPIAWLARELEASGLSVTVPRMPHPNKPTINDWVETIAKNVVDSEKTIIIGHSIGCQAVLRYLQSSKKKFSGVFLVAPWLKIKPGALNDEETKIALPWQNTPLDLSNIKKKSDSFYFFYSTNDPFVSVDDSLTLKNKIGGELHNLGEKGHISEDDGIFEWPEMLELIEKNFILR